MLNAKEFTDHFVYNNPFGLYYDDSNIILSDTTC